MLIGVHVPMHNSKTSQEKLGADVVQIVLGSPQQWGQTKLPKGEVASPIYVHAPYLINLSTHSPEVLQKSRNTLWQQSLTANEIGALGVVVHGGSWKKISSKTKAMKQWERTFGKWFHTKILIENSATGQHSMTRYLEDLEELWEAISAEKKIGHIGFCLDTCHLWSGGMGYAEGRGKATDTVEAILSVVGKIDLVHANGSGTEYGSGKDVHSPLAKSVAPIEWITEVIEACQPDAIIAETTDPVDDLRILRKVFS